MFPHLFLTPLLEGHIRNIAFVSTVARIAALVF
jgi:hypothetical protein